MPAKLDLLDMIRTGIIKSQFRTFCNRNGAFAIERRRLRRTPVRDLGQCNAVNESPFVPTTAEHSVYGLNSWNVQPLHSQDVSTGILDRHHCRMRDPVG